MNSAQRQALRDFARAMRNAADYVASSAAAWDGAVAADELAGPGPLAQDVIASACYGRLAESLDELAYTLRCVASEVEEAEADARAAAK